MAKIYTIFRHSVTSLVLQRVMKRKLILCCIFSMLKYALCEECMSESDCLSTYRNVYYCADLICPNDTSTSTTTVSTTPLQNPETQYSQVFPPSPTILPNFGDSDSLDDDLHSNNSEIVNDLNKDPLNDTFIQSPISPNRVFIPPDTVIPSRASDINSENSSEEYDTFEYSEFSSNATNQSDGDYYSDSDSDFPFEYFEFTSNATNQSVGDYYSDSDSDFSSESNITGPTTPLSTILTSTSSIPSHDTIDAETANDTNLEAPDDSSHDQLSDESTSSNESNATQYFDIIDPLNDDNSSTVTSHCDPEPIAIPNSNSTDLCKDYYEIPFLSQVPAILLEKFNSILFYYVLDFSGHKFLWPFIFHNNLRLLFLFAVGRLHIQVEYFNFILLVYAYHYAGDPLYLPVCLQIMSMPAQLEPYKDQKSPLLAAFRSCLEFSHPSWTFCFL